MTDPTAGRFFVLDGRKPRACSRAEWNEWLENHDEERVVNHTEFHAPGSIRTVRTLFLALPHRPVRDEAPFFFGTVAELGARQVGPSFTRTWEAAEAMHRAFVAAVRTGRFRDIEG